MDKTCIRCSSAYKSVATQRNRPGNCKLCKNILVKERYVINQLKKGKEVNRFTNLMATGQKECINCNQVKLVSAFSKRKGDNKLRSNCKQCESVFSKIYNDQNKDKINAARRRRRSDPIRGIIFSQRDRQRSLFRGAKQYSVTNTIRLWLGCSVDDCKKHIESLFVIGMNWSSRGIGLDKWQIDHKIPVSLTMLAETGEMIDCEFNRKIWHYTNLQPLWHSENAAKSNTYVPAALKVLTFDGQISTNEA